MHMTTQILTQSKNSDNELKQTIIPTKNAGLLSRSAVLPSGRSPPVGGWLSRWSRESQLTFGRCARSVQNHPFGGAPSTMRVQCVCNATIWTSSRPRGPYFVILWALLLFENG